MKTSPISVECFRIQTSDNVATLLQDAEEAAEILILGETDLRSIGALQSIKSGHKVALGPLAEGAYVVKYGFPIAVATRAILAGEWVHLHNCRSLQDERSSHLDINSGSRKDATYV